MRDLVPTKWSVQGENFLEELQAPDGLEDTRKLAVAVQRWGQVHFRKLATKQTSKDLGAAIQVSLHTRFPTYAEASHQNELFKDWNQRMEECEGLWRSVAESECLFWSCSYLTVLRRCGKFLKSIEARLAQR